MRAFSLIEILIAAALLGMMGVILMSSLTSSIDVRDKAEGISGRHHLIRQALSRMSSEISMAYVSTNRNPNLVMDTQFKGEKSSVGFVAFGGLQHRQDAKESGEREITYFLKDGNLMRREKENPGRTLFETGKARLVCPKVDGLLFKYWNQTTSAWDSQWKTEGKPVADMSLPSRVRIELTAKLNEDEIEKITTETEIWLTTPIFLGQ
ncbi:MAG: type II secretion system protein GspJ [Myxococcota bacterium]